MVRSRSPTDCWPAQSPAAAHPRYRQRRALRSVSPPRCARPASLASFSISSAVSSWSRRSSCIHLLRPNRTLQRRRRVLHQDLAVVDDGDPVAQLVRLFHVVRRQHHGDPFFTQPPHRIPHRNPALRIEPRRRLIQKQHLRPVRNRPRNLHPLRQPAGKLRGIRLRPLRQVELRQKLVRPLLRVRPRKPEVKAMKVDVLEDRASPVKRVVLRHHPHASPCHRRRLHHIHTGNAHRAGGRQRARRADTDGRGLARAVRPKQTKQLALPDPRSIPSTATTRCLPS